MGESRKARSQERDTSVAATASAVGQELADILTALQLSLDVLEEAGPIERRAITGEMKAYVQKGARAIGRLRTALDAANTTVTSDDSKQTGARRRAAPRGDE